MPFIKDIRPSIKGNMENYPQILVFGQFKLHIEQYTAAGRYSEATGMIEGVSGYAWLNYDLEDVSGSFFPSLDLQGYQNIYNILEVVSSVKNPQTEISIDEAKRFKPNISVGDNLELKFSVDHDRFKKIIKEEMNFTKTLKELYMKNKILLFFENITIQKSNPDVTNPLIIDHPIIGNVIYGKAVYPHHRAFPPITAIIINDFTIQIHEIELTTTEARANLAIRLPNCIGERYRCTPATVDIGWVIIDNNFEFYVERNEKYGPWIIGETGLIVYGEKLIVDFSSSKSPSFINPSFKGIYLLEGKVSGRELNPKESNTGYLAGDYHFDYAIITPEGFTGNIQLDKDFSFNPINPTGYKINIINGQLDIFNCSIKGGHFGPGNVELPKKAILEESTNDCFIADFTEIRVYDNLDLFGEILFKSHSLASWGDLTNPVDLKKHWNISMNRGYIYLPAGSISTFYPISGNQYISLDLSINAYAELASKHVAGITTVGIEVIAFFSPDSEHGLIDFPIKFIEVEGWINIGHSGIHGSLVSQMQYPRRLGNVNRVGYIANTSFDNTFNTQDRRSLIGEFVMSSVYNSDIKGELFIPNPCQMILNYDKMKLTSTVNIVGGDITLPSNGVTLDYWKLQLEPQTGQSVAGYLSIRTGVIAMTAASLSERIHFEKPFPLIWAEIHADGNIKDFIFDYSTDGQKFDKFPFVPAHIELSEYVPDKFDCYIAVCGTVHFNVFGGYYIAVRDARYDPNTGAPHFNRYVSLPKNFKEACKPTNLELYTEWANQVLKLHFPNDQMRYNEDTQNGFNGEGTIDVSVLIGTLSANIVLCENIINISSCNDYIYDINFGLLSQFGAIGHIGVCLMIDAPTISSMSIHGLLETNSSSGHPLLKAKYSGVIEVILTLTRNNCIFMASGDFALALTNVAHLDVMGEIFLKKDFQSNFAEGSIIGRINCGAITQLSASGQATWFISNEKQILQAQLTLNICDFSMGTGVEGGFFLGRNADRDEVWVLRSGHPDFRYPDSTLPEKLTGFFAYSQVSDSINIVVLSGGYTLYLGLGAFTQPLIDSSSVHSVSGLSIYGRAGAHIHGEILGGLVSASAWGLLDLYFPPLYFSGTVGLKGCVLWGICKTLHLNVKYDHNGFDIDW